MQKLAFIDKIGNLVEVDSEIKIINSGEFYDSGYYKGISYNGEYVYYEPFRSRKRTSNKEVVLKVPYYNVIAAIKNVAQYG